ncbi:MAG: heme exporter protein CcmB, partial [Candidatus Dadabacteria bacterium]|nr:heme exporter protein CcmB [Candidatus Dadabacteria bacterium]
RKVFLGEAGSKQIFPTIFVFSLLLLLVFNVAFEFRSDVDSRAISAVIWITFIFSGLLALGRSFSLEKENNAFAFLLLTPVSRSCIYLGKLLSNTVMVLLSELFILPLFLLFFLFDSKEISLSFTGTILPFLGVMVLGTIGFVSLGTFFSSMALNTKLRDMMLPLLVFPLIIPVVITSVGVCSSILEGRPPDYYAFSLQVLVSFDIIFILLCSILFEYLIEDSGD